MRQITISGNIGKDAELRSTNNGMQVSNFNVAVRQNRPDNNGEYGTDWFRCSVWGTRASTVEKFYKKGSHVVVTGSLSINEYNGKTQLQVDVSDFDLPDNRNTNNANSTQKNSNNSFNNGGQSIDIGDDSLPF
ncbi:single-stranded DNA-binding protein [Pediococcus pentosaceus]|uniref:single-stranded DNA-binding protein n=1 Tax=Pediococcus pentosaceus TaxID=1255 RepID=UPI00190AEC2F|nr:single-stranded DNA-binding protein [Pediococcus pentosaceus]MBF7125848.1 single-stranded DNA-binding protein [Pediococcus pentosaceus]WPK15853.1 single-stranded DNA-binding protein [Pediococcus pentosaceus]